MPDILVIDDDAAVRKAVGLMLAVHGFEVSLADGGAAALRMLAMQGCDLVISDMTMPGMDGFETIRAIRSRHPNMAIIAMSGFSDTGSGCDATCFLQDPAAFGADLSLAKPFRAPALLAAVNALLLSIRRLPIHVGESNHLESPSLQTSGGGL